jgi:general secretion pathway protein G
MRRVTSQAGFTLLEIMVVVFILGLLVTLVVPRIMRAGVQAKRTKAGADVKAIEESLEMFKLENGFYPSTVDGLQMLVQPTSKAANANREGYLKKLPIDPWGNPYAYFSDGQTFLVKSYGSDGQEGGDGEKADIVSDDL